MKNTEFKLVKDLLNDERYEKVFNYEFYDYQFVSDEETISFDFDSFTEKQKIILNKYF